MKDQIMLWNMDHSYERAWGEVTKVTEIEHWGFNVYWPIDRS